MNAQEMKDLALKASKKQYEEVIRQFKAEAEKGSFTLTVSDLSDGTVQLLRESGYSVEQKRSMPSGALTNSFKVSVKN